MYLKLNELDEVFKNVHDIKYGKNAAHICSICQKEKKEEEIKK